MSEADLLLPQINRLFRLLTRASREVGEQTPMTATQRLALTEIADAGPLRLHELAARMGTTAPTASRAVDALVSSELVGRVEDLRDRRAVQIDLTRRGRRHVDARRAEVARVLAPAFGHLDGPQQETLVRLLSRLNDELLDSATVHEWARTASAR